MTFHKLFSSEDTGKLFEPDTVLAAQYYATVKRSPYREPELRLMAAVLEDAVACLSTKMRHGNVRQRKQFEAANDWISKTGDSEWIFSFDNVCESLGMNPDYLRQRLAQSADNVLAEVSRPVSTRTARQRSIRHKKLRLRTGT